MRMGIDIPKTLLPLPNNPSILQRLLSQLAPFLSPQEIIIVVGYQHEKIRAAFPQYPFVHNPSYHKENTAKSLLRALQTIDDDILWINGDVVLKDDLLSPFLAQNQTAIMVYRSPDVGPEEVKFHSHNNTITALSKEVSNPEGESIGVQLWQKKRSPPSSKTPSPKHPPTPTSKPLSKPVSNKAPPSTPSKSNPTTL